MELGLAPLSELEQVAFQNLLPWWCARLIVDAYGRPDCKARRIHLAVVVRESARAREELPCSVFPSCGSREVRSRLLEDDPVKREFGSQLVEQCKLVDDPVIVAKLLHDGLVELGPALSLLRHRIQGAIGVGGLLGSSSLSETLRTSAVSTLLLSKLAKVACAFDLTFECVLRLGDFPDYSNIHE